MLNTYAVVKAQHTVSLCDWSLLRHHQINYQINAACTEQITCTQALAYRSQENGCNYSLDSYRQVPTCKQFVQCTWHLFGGWFGGALITINYEGLTVYWALAVVVLFPVENCIGIYWHCIENDEKLQF